MSQPRMIGLLLAILSVSGCEAAPDRAQALTGEATVTEADRIRHHLGRLADRGNIRTYGDADNPRTWYIAAEALGEIGKPAVPALIQRLDSPDPYEVKLALYALMLASQDPALRAETGGDYLRLDTVLTEEGNESNRRLARDWWQRYRHLWP